MSVVEYSIRLSWKRLPAFEMLNWIDCMGLQDFVSACLLFMDVAINLHFFFAIKGVSRRVFRHCPEAHGSV